MTVLPAPDVPASRLVGRASVMALLAVAAEAPSGAVLESVWHRSRSLADLSGLPGNIVEVFCRCDPATAAQRYARRAGTRAAGHFDAERMAGELWNDDVAQPVAGGWPVIEVDTTAPVELSPPGGRDRTFRRAAALTSRARCCAAVSAGARRNRRPPRPPAPGRRRPLPG